MFPFVILCVCATDAWVMDLGGDCFVWTMFVVLHAHWRITTMVCFDMVRLRIGSRWVKDIKFINTKTHIFCVYVGDNLWCRKKTLSGVYHLVGRKLAHNLCEKNARKKKMFQWCCEPGWQKQNRNMQMNKIARCRTVRKLCCALFISCSLRIVPLRLEII